jgi:hypothetical protein
VGDDGPCPDYDPDTGEQLDMKCVCGASVPLSSRFSICAGCMRRSRIEDGDYDDDYSMFEREHEYDYE